MAKTRKPKLDRTQIIVAIIAAIAAIVVGYWQFVWVPQNTPPSDSNQSGLEYVGRVLDSTTNEPIGNAKVTFDFQGAPLIVYTDSEGVYRFTTNVESDRIVGRVRVAAENYDNYDRNITLFTDNPSIEDIRLVSR